MTSHAGVQWEMCQHRLLHSLLHVFDHSSQHHDTAEPGDESLSHDASVSGTGHIFCKVLGPHSRMANSLRGMGRNNAIRDQGTLTCPPGSYAFATSGQSGKSVDRVSCLTCRNIYTGAVSTATGNAFGGGGGKASTRPL